MKATVFAFCYLLTGNTAIADSPVWRISSGGNHLYLAGTIHLLTRQDYPLPAAFERAWGRSDELVFETDLAELEKPAFVQKLIARGSYPEGRSIADSLSPEIFHVLTEYLESHGFDKQLLQMKPGLISISLTMAELQRVGMAQQGVDQHFYQRARAWNKPVSAFETIDQQIEFLVAMGEGNEDAFIRQMLEELGSISEDVVMLKRFWRIGDLSSLEAISISDWKSRFPDVYQQLLVVRNRNWLALIERMLVDKDVEMVMVGALHLAGPDGLLAMLLSAGYQVEQLP